VKPISILDYNKSMIWVDLKDQLLHSYLIERKRMNKWYMKLFCRLLNTAILNVIIYRSNTAQKIEKLSFRIELIERLFVKYASSVDHTVPARQSSNTVPHITEKKKERLQNQCVVCQKHGNTVYWCDACGV
jgi:hypothetical protein